MKKIDKSKFTIQDVYWYDGDPFTPPGYRVFIKVEGYPYLHDCLVSNFDVEGNKISPVNESWIIEDKK